MKAVGRSKESLERLINILLYKDEEFCLSRVYGVSCYGDIIQEDGLWSCEMFGSCAWSTQAWFIPDNQLNHIYTYGRHFRNDTGPVYKVFSDICKELDIGVEVFSCDEMGGLQEHNITNHLGSTITHPVDYMPDLNGGHNGGYKNYGEFLNSNNIY